MGSLQLPGELGENGLGQPASVKGEWAHSGNVKTWEI